MAGSGRTQPGPAGPASASARQDPSADAVRGWEAARQRAERWTWRLVAGITRRITPTYLTEEHPGGGHYDEIVVYLPTGDGRPAEPAALPQIRMNRNGRVHVQHGAHRAAWEMWDDLDNGANEATQVQAMLTAALAAPPGRSATVLPVGRAYSVMARLVQRGLKADRRQWEWRNGFHDSSAMDAGGPRRELFQALPLAEWDCLPHHGDLLDVPQYRFWFLLHDGAPVLAAQPLAGLLYTADDRIDVASANDVKRASTLLPARRQAAIARRRPPRRTPAAAAGLGEDSA
jgi:hypothetical protein